MLDARGYGYSEAPETDYSQEAMAGDVAGVIRGLGLGTAGIIGHSMGAMTAGVTAANYPELVNGMDGTRMPSDHAPGSEGIRVPT